MFFALSKIIWALISPVNFILLLFLLGFFLFFGFKKASYLFVLFGSFLFVFYSIVPIGGWSLYPLESYYERPKVPKNIDGILVLGGSVETALSDDLDTIALNESAERLTEALRLKKHYPQAKLVFSGGNGDILNSEGTEAEIVKHLFDDLGFKGKQFIYEDQSRNTYENVIFTMDLVKPKDDENWVLVTSAFHMPRSIGVAQKSGWTNIIPYPVDYRQGKKTGLIPQNFQFLYNINKLQIAMHEYIGILAYTASGKMTFPAR